MVEKTKLGGNLEPAARSIIRKSFIQLRIRSASRLHRIPSPTDIDHDDTDSSTSEDDNSDAVGSSPNSFRASATSGTIGVAGPVKAVAVERGQRAGDEAGDGGANPRGGGQLEQLPFVLVAKEHLVGTWLAVFVRSNLFPRVSDVRTGECQLFD